MAGSSRSVLASLGQLEAGKFLLEIFCETKNDTNNNDSTNNNNSSDLIYIFLFLKDMMILSINY